MSWCDVYRTAPRAKSPKVINIHLEASLDYFYRKIITYNEEEIQSEQNILILLISLSEQTHIPSKVVNHPRAIQIVFCCGEYIYNVAHFAHRSSGENILLCMRDCHGLGATGEVLNAFYVRNLQRTNYRSISRIWFCAFFATQPQQSMIWCQSRQRVDAFTTRDHWGIISSMVHGECCVAEELNINKIGPVLGRMVKSRQTNIASKTSETS